SSGTLLGIEAQNYPDSRILVSWVADTTYSRGRWLDDEGTIIGELYDLSLPHTSKPLAKSIVRLNQQGAGILYQYERGYWQDSVRVTYLDENAIPISHPELISCWYHWTGPPFTSSTTFHFPGLIYLGDQEYITGYYYSHMDDYMGSPPSYKYENHLYSTILDSSAIIDLSIHNSDVQLCRLGDDKLIYLMGYNPPTLQVFQMSTLQELTDVITLPEPGFYAATDKPDIVVHENGDFRCAFINHLTPEPHAYTKYFYASGIPVAPDTVASIDIDNEPGKATVASIEGGSENQCCIAWTSWGQDALTATSYSGSIWSQTVERLVMVGWEENLSTHFAIDADINNDIEAIVEIEVEESGTFLSLRAFEDFFSSLGSITLPLDNYEPDYFDVAVRDNGTFAYVIADDSLIVQAGDNYLNLSSDPIRIAPEVPFVWTADALIETSPSGYWITWRGRVDDTQHRYLQRLGQDGNPVGQWMVIDSTDADPTGKPDLAVSSSGNFAVCWQDARFDEGDIFCRQFNPDGSFYGREYRVNSDPVGPLQKEPAVAFGPNDQLYFTWTDYRNEGNQGDIYCKVIEWIDATAVEPETEPVPLTFALHPPYPNPFNPTTTLTFTLPVAAEVDLTVYNVHGQNVVGARHPDGSGQVAAPSSGSGATPTTGYYSPGTHTIQFDGSNLASGIYFVRLQAGDYSAMQKLVLLK
ncbi:MAG: T9SS type A sorting domain-containing protein, partial [bacterium]